MDTEFCGICEENVIWYEYENHLEAHYEGVFDREMESRLENDLEKGRAAR